MKKFNPSNLKLMRIQANDAKLLPYTKVEYFKAHDVLGYPKLPFIGRYGTVELSGINPELSVSIDSGDLHIYYKKSDSIGVIIDDTEVYLFDPNSVNFDDLDVNEIQAYAKGYIKDNEIHITHQYVDINYVPNELVLTKTLTVFHSILMVVGGLLVGFGIPFIMEDLWLQGVTSILTGLLAVVSCAYILKYAVKE